MSLTLAGIIRDPDTGKARGIAIIVDGGRLRVELSATSGGGKAAVDFTDHAAALVAALTETERDDSNG
jgi:hypothetical protein